MSRLAAYQVILANAVSSPVAHGAWPAELGEMSPVGLRQTMRVRRSWCRARAARAASLTLSALPPLKRAELIEAWVRAGGGTRSFFEQEADAFLAFMAERLEGPSHQKSLCLFERAIVRASKVDWVPPGAMTVTADTILQRSPDAALVKLGAPIAVLLDAIEGRVPWPDIDPDGPSLLVAPGINGRAREASRHEIVLWNAAGAGCVAGREIAAARAMLACGALVERPI